MAYNYPYGNGQQLNLDWFLNEWKNLLAAWEAEKNGIAGALDAEIAKAEAALADVFAARDAAAQSAANALESKNAAAQSASDASGYLTTVRADANTASNAAQNAAQSESNAAESAQTALASKNTAANSERNAAQSEANALASKNAAAQSAADALANKDAAAQSAADALANKNAAAQSAEDAEDAAASVEKIRQVIPTPFLPIQKFRKGTYSAGSAELYVDQGGLIHFKNSELSNVQFCITGNENSVPSIATSTSDLANSFYIPEGIYKIKFVPITTFIGNCTFYLRKINSTTIEFSTSALSGYFETTTNITEGNYALFIRQNNVITDITGQFIIERVATTNNANVAMLLENM